MTLYELYNANVIVQYKNTLCSKATFFVIVTTVIALIFPLILSYRTRGFWLKSYKFYEQPNVHFKYQYLFIAETNDFEYVITCGNLNNSTKLQTLPENCFQLKIHEIDYNFDKKPDELYLHLLVNNQLLKNILNIKLILLVDFKLDGVCPLQMESLIIHEESFGLPIAKYFLTGSLKFVQTSPLPCLYNYKDVRFNTSVISSNPNEIDRWLKNVLYDYSKRNVSTTLTNIYTDKTHGSVSTFELEMFVGIPEHSIRYKPGVWQELKFIWQQYISIAIIFYWLLIKIKAYVFKNCLLPAWKKDPLKKEF